jgi:hypothetical protein
MIDCVVTHACAGSASNAASISPDGIVNLIKTVELTCEKRTSKWGMYPFPGLGC